MKGNRIIISSIYMYMYTPTGRIKHIGTLNVHDANISPLEIYSPDTNISLLISWAYTKDVNNDLTTLFELPVELVVMAQYCCNLLLKASKDTTGESRLTASLYV